MIGSERQRIWSTHIFLFKICITETFEQSVQWSSILLENDIFENPENQNQILKIKNVYCILQTTPLPAWSTPASPCSTCPPAQWWWFPGSQEIIPLDLA